MQETDKPPATKLKYLPPYHQRILAALLVFLLALLVLLESGIVKQMSGDTVSQDSSSETNSIIAPAGIPTIPVEPPKDSMLALEVSNGDTLSSLFKQAGFGPELVDDIINSNKEAKVLGSLYPGNHLIFEIDANKSLVSLEVFKSPLDSFKFAHKDTGGFSFQHLVRKPEIKFVTREAVITDSLFLAAQQGGIPTSMSMELAGIFGGVIDFILDTREGDTFKVLFEEQYLDGKKIGIGNILAAEFVNQGKHFIAMRYQDQDGNVNFFSPAGESMHKAFLLNPVDFTRISSGFSLSRRHPILNTIRAHKGTDYAAPRGTPVVATADGRITFASTNGSFGKLVVVKHNDRFMTKYAHLNAFAKGIKQGARVRQGEVIGYVGMTGAATGPHLHYEFLMDGIQRDSRKIYDKLPQAVALGKQEMILFRQQTSSYLTMLTQLDKSGILANAVGQGNSKTPVLLQ